MNNKDFNNILNECLDRIIQGGTIRECLQKYPEQASELAPLLKTALEAKSLSAIKPRAEFKMKASAEFRAALVKKNEEARERKSFYPWQWSWRSGWAVAVVSLFVVVVGLGGTVIAANGTMPDNFLYPVKLATENVQMAFTFNDLDKAELNARLADRRVKEIVYLSSKGNSQQIQAVAQNLNTNLANMNTLVGAPLAAVTQSPAGGQTPLFGVDSQTQSSESTVASEPSSSTAAPMLAAPAATASPGPMAPFAAATPKVTSNATALPAGNRAASTTPAQPTLSVVSNPPSSLTAVVKDGKLAELRQVVTDNAIAQEAELSKAIEQAPPELKPALRDALAKTTAEYERALQALEQEQGK